MFLYPPLHPQVGDFMYVRHGALGTTGAAPPAAAAAADGAVTPSDASAVAANGIGVLRGSEGATSGSGNDGALVDGEDETKVGMSDGAGEEEKEAEAADAEEEGVVSESDITFTNVTAGLNGAPNKPVARSRHSGKHKVGCGHADTVPAY